MSEDKEEIITSPDKNEGVITSPDKNEGVITSPDKNEGVITSPDKNEGVITSVDKNEENQQQLMLLEDSIRDFYLVLQAKADATSVDHAQSGILTLQQEIEDIKKEFEILKNQSTISKDYQETKVTKSDGQFTVEEAISQFSPTASLFHDIEVLKTKQIEFDFYKSKTNEQIEVLQKDSKKSDLLTELALLRNENKELREHLVQAFHKIDQLQTTIENTQNAVMQIASEKTDIGELQKIVTEISELKFRQENVETNAGATESAVSLVHSELRNIAVATEDTRISIQSQGIRMKDYEIAYNQFAQQTASALAEIRQDILILAQKKRAEARK
ncbi:MAG: hypothetical protein EZS28_000281 [Streblomastix strix]|uniref:Uncharacterized protein n=1 Tax=Streblomastix strix TaxID=222440 RepID=A0A5J4XAA9_9EUKA|nr:MAG: hypothetical protein EZS28_000281 [Streblomastix strix]